jgi:hypothetical protein
MKITRFTAKGFRSLAAVELEGLGAFNVFYGRNGTGKSNILQAIRTLFSLLHLLGHQPSWFRLPAKVGNNPEALEAARIALAEGALQRRDLRVGDSFPRVVLGATLSAPDVDETGRVDRSLTVGEMRYREIVLEVTFDMPSPGAPVLWLSQMGLDGQPLDKAIELAGGSVTKESFAKFLLRLAEGDFALVGAERGPHSEEARAPPDDEDNVVAWHLRAGRLKNALFVAQNSPDPAMRQRLKALRALLEGPPLHRPPFDVVQDPRTREVDVREPLAGGSDVSLDLAGLGIAQMYTMLASITLAGTRAVGIEEPEAHLHAPTSGRHLRALLGRVVAEGGIQQLFIATHSNLFDLDPGGYFEVTLEGGATRVTRRPLDRIDLEHLYEPGPAKHLLAEMLDYVEPGEVVFRTGEGAPVTALEMLDELRKDTDLAVSFLRSIHAAALETVGFRARRKKA